LKKKYKLYTESQYFTLIRFSSNMYAAYLAMHLIQKLDCLN